MLFKPWRTIQTVLTALMALCVFAGASPAAQKTRTLEGHYFTLTVEGRQGVDYNSVLADLGVAKLSESYAQQATEDPEVALKEGLDAVVSKVSKTLGVPIEHFHVAIRVYSSHDQLTKAIKKNYGIGVGEQGYFYNGDIGFYDYDNRTVYISLDKANVGVVAHELAHAIISQYFVVPAPTNTQEILAGYAEFSVRKSLQQK